MGDFGSHLRETCFQNPAKVGVNKQALSNQNIKILNSETINLITSNYEDQARTTNIPLL